jgi:long-subunit acyl-CoA synthetase (AMP-forming)
VLGSEGLGTLRANLAVIATGATLVPLDPRISDEGLRRVLASSGAVQAIASDERHLSRILSLRPDLPALELVLLDSAAPSERKTAALLVEAAIAVGIGNLADDPGLLRTTTAGGDSGAACLLVDAAGETRPVSRSSLLAVVDTIAQAVGVARGTTLLAALPVGSAERIGAALAVMSRGATLLLQDPSERPDAGLDQRPADAVLLDVNTLERLHRAWVADIDARPSLGRAATRWALRQGREAQPDGWKRRVAERLALAGLREKLGGRAARLDVIALQPGGASSDTESFFRATGLSLRYLFASKAR